MSKLAIQGGDKAITLDQSEASEWPIIDDEVTEAVVDQLQSGEISFSDTIYKFEEEFAAYHGVKYALAHNNGTASIHGALFGIGVGPGDEVITRLLQRFGARICPSSPVRRFRSSAILIRSQVALTQKILSGESLPIRKRSLSSISVECRQRWTLSWKSQNVTISSWLKTALTLTAQPTKAKRSGQSEMWVVSVCREENSYRAARVG